MDTKKNSLVDRVQTRRRFLAFGVAGAVPLFAGGVRAFAQRPAGGRPPGLSDPVLDQIAHEMGRIHTSIKTRGLRAEHVHEAASQFRLVLTHARASNLDAKASRAVGAAIDRDGRDAILNADADQRKIALLVAPFGFDLSDHAQIMPSARDRKSDVLNTLMLTGLTPLLGRVTTALAAAEPRADRLLAGSVDQARSIPVDFCGWDLICDEMAILARLFEWIDPELGAILWCCYAMCEVLGWFLCGGWGG